jgi:hypothetical protein
VQEQRRRQLRSVNLISSTVHLQQDAVDAVDEVRKPVSPRLERYGFERVSDTEYRWQP